MKKLTHRRLAEGEATGHFHEAAAEDVELFDAGTHLVVKAPTGTPVTHQEHGTINVEPGTFERTIVRTVDEDEEFREVVD